MSYFPASYQEYMQQKDGSLGQPHDQQHKQQQAMGMATQPTGKENQPLPRGLPYILFVIEDDHMYAKSVAEKLGPEFQLMTIVPTKQQGFPVLGSFLPTLVPHGPVNYPFAVLFHKSYTKDDLSELRGSCDHSPAAEKAMWLRMVPDPIIAMGKGEAAAFDEMMQHIKGTLLETYAITQGGGGDEGGVSHSRGYLDQQYKDVTYSGGQGQGGRLEGGRLEGGRLEGGEYQSGQPYQSGTNQGGGYSQGQQYEGEMDARGMSTEESHDGEKKMKKKEEKHEYDHKHEDKYEHEHEHLLDRLSKGLKFWKHHEEKKEMKKEKAKMKWEEMREEQERREEEREESKGEKSGSSSSSSLSGKEEREEEWEDADQREGECKDKRGEEREEEYEEEKQEEEKAESSSSSSEAEGEAEQEEEQEEEEEEEADDGGDYDE